MPLHTFIYLASLSFRIFFFFFLKNKTNFNSFSSMKENAMHEEENIKNSFSR